MGSVLSQIVSHDNTPTDEEIEIINQFYKDYAEQLHHAWFLNVVNPRRESNMIYDYKLKRMHGKGAFGGVYEAEDANGNICAIKVLSPEVNFEKDYLNCFRRGVHTMKILSENNLQGMPKLHKAFEVPACIVMDYVEGLALRTVIDGNMLSISSQEIIIKLKIILNIAKIINTAHDLEEHVLHRDLKPENIILENFYSARTIDDFDDISVKIVDFDLSWHRGARGKTVTATGSVGFVAPEQLSEQSRVNTKNAAVDIYSIGMLMYYILTGQNPYPNQHISKNFYEDIIKSIEKQYSFKWKMTSKYLSQIIIEATKQEQEQRTTLSVIISKLATIIKMESEYNMLPCSHELLTREIAIRIDNTIEIKDSPKGGIGDIIASQNSLGKKFEFKRNYDSYNRKFSLSIRIVKQAHADELRLGKVEDLTKRAINLAKSKVDKSIFEKYNIDWEKRAIIAHLTTKLSDEISLDAINKISNNLTKIASEMKFGF